MEKVKRRKQLKPKQCHVLEKVESDKKETCEASITCTRNTVATNAEGVQMANCISGAVDKKLTGLSCRGLRPASSAVDRDLWEWYCETRNARAIKVTKNMVQARAKKSFHEAGIINFKASDGWYRRWVCRWRRFGYRKNAVGDECCKVEPSGDKDNSKTLVDKIEANAVDGSSQSETGSHSKFAVKTKVQNWEPTNCSGSKYTRVSGSTELNVSNDLNKVDSVSNHETSMKNDSTTTLSTPMLNIVDYLPPEIMQDFQGNKIPENNINSMGSAYAMSSANANCSYYSPSYELLSGCDQETLPNLTFELHQNDSMSVSNEAERLKDLVSFISSQQNSSSNLPFTNIEESENIISTCTSEDSEDFVDTIFRNVALTMDDQEENSNSSAQLTSTVSQDALAPEVILESQSSNVETRAEEVREVKKSRRSKDSHHSSVPAPQRKRGERYLPQFKAKVLAYASSHTLKATSKKFKVNDGTIISWKKEKNWKQQLAQNCINPSGYDDTKKDSKFNPIDQQFLTWLRRCREQGRNIVNADLKDKVRHLADQENLDDSHWFKMWVDRFDTEDKELEECSEVAKPKKERHIQYPQAFKMEVAYYAEQRSQLLAARTFNVSRKRVFDWLKILRDKIISDLSKGSSEPSTNPPKNSSERRDDVDRAVDQCLWEWYEAQQKTGNKPNWHEVQTKGLELYRAKGNEEIKCSYRWYKRWCDRFHVVLRHEGDEALLKWALTQLEQGHSLTLSDLQVQALNMASHNAFKASRGWAIRFCKRYPELLQQSPLLDTSLPSLLLQEVQKFRCSVQKTILDKNFTLGSIGNMDELYLNFSNLMSGNVNTKRQLLVRKSEMENCHATIVLCCLADGNILPPAVIFKVSGIEEAELAMTNALVLQQEEGIMDAVCLEKWLQLIWFKHVPKPNLLLVDCLDAHTEESISQEFSKHQSTRLIIPGGCTSKLQPLDISLKNLFQAFIQKKWLTFNSCSSREWDVGDNKLHLPGWKDILEWVSGAYHELQATEQETVRRSFLVTGLTVSPNRSEDHFIENLSMIPKTNASISS